MCRQSTLQSILCGVQDFKGAAALSAESKALAAQADISTDEAKKLRQQASALHQTWPQPQRHQANTTYLKVTLTAVSSDTACATHGHEQNCVSAGAHQQHLHQSSLAG